eukprot:768680-Hanusia_phi.AAC.6
MLDSRGVIRSPLTAASYALSPPELQHALSAIAAASFTSSEESQSRLVSFAVTPRSCRAMAPLLVLPIPPARSAALHLSCGWILLIPARSSSIPPSSDSSSSSPADATILSSAFSSCRFRGSARCAPRALLVLAILPMAAREGRRGREMRKSLRAAC